MEVSFSIVSINVGILGFMTFWNVRLDFISMVTIVMSIGFCVDFAAHLAYNFAKGQNLPASERMRDALYAVGAPILQSATSTILGVSFLASAESYVFRSFLKTIFLVILLGMYASPRKIDNTIENFRRSAWSPRPSGTSNNVSLLWQC
ncbi:unnamed protein product [Strongylus vulgaris]|uniref:SSD domain-containing protein n=1 Tax=Strongylus vulgaris TaxID=40348 RepID=A0A3P7J356_STRVU|nr:unnamed protein product [Strongylus vulgaris]